MSVLLKNNSRIKGHIGNLLEMDPKLLKGRQDFLRQATKSTSAPAKPKPVKEKKKKVSKPKVAPDACKPHRCTHSYCSFVKAILLSVPEAVSSRGSAPQTILSYDQTLCRLFEGEDLRIL